MDYNILGPVAKQEFQTFGTKDDIIREDILFLLEFEQEPHICNRFDTFNLYVGSQTNLMASFF